MGRNEILTLLDDTKTWWKVKNKNGKVGYVPSNYIQKKKTKTFGPFGGSKNQNPKDSKTPSAPAYNMAK